MKRIALIILVTLTTMVTLIGTASASQKPIFVEGARPIHITSQKPIFVE